MPSEVSIRCLLAAGKFDSFTKAAEELFMTRQAVSRQIAVFEKELGARLFDRTTARVSLTPVGVVYYRFFSQMQAKWEDTQRKAAAILSEQAESVSIGCPYAIDLGERVLEIVERCKKNGYPIRVNWERREPYDLLSHLFSGHFDIVFSFSGTLAAFAKNSELESTPFSDIQSMLLVRDSHPLVRPGVEAADLQQEPCYITESMLSSDLGLTGFLAEWATVGMRFTDVRTMPDRETLQTMVELGRGVTISNSMERFTKHPHICALPLNRFQKIMCVWRKNEKKAQVLNFLGVMNNF